MDIKKNNPLIFSLFLTTLFLFFISPSAIAASRGDSVTAKTSSGDIKEIKLYTGYHALIIGCGDYQKGWPRLPNPIADIQEVASLLKSLGWSVGVLKDPDGKTLKRELNKLVIYHGREKEKAIFVWFSGHGHTIKEADGTKLGYLVPIDAPDPGKDLLGFLDIAISMRQIESVSKQIMSKHVLMAFDSCFSGALFRMVRANPSPYIQ